MDRVSRETLKSGNPRAPFGQENLEKLIEVALVQTGEAKDLKTALEKSRNEIHIHGSSTLGGDERLTFSATLIDAYYPNNLIERVSEEEAGPVLFDSIDDLSQRGIPVLQVKYGYPSDILGTIALAQKLDNENVVFGLSFMRTRVSESKIQEIHEKLKEVCSNNVYLERV